MEAAAPAERNWFAPEKSVPGMWDMTAVMNGVWTCFLLAELAASVATGKKVYNLRQSINNLAAWLLTTLYVALVKAVTVFPYVWVYNRYCLVTWPVGATWGAHLCALLYTDFIFYCGHRLAHECNLMWSTHVVHHSSPDFNYSTGFRAGFLEHTLPFMFWLPLALVCPPQIYFLHKFLNQLIMFWAHTEMIGKLWWPIEFFVVTPSHHRVHHARNYGRKNFGGLFILWDRIFGTFQEERQDRKPLYGLNAQRVVQGTYNPLWHQVHHLLATFRLAASGKVSVFKALYTRITGPGMIHPTTTDCIASEATEAHHSNSSGAAKATGKQGAAGDAVQINASAGSRAQKSDGTSQAVDSGFPWESRPLGALDYYAAYQFFLLVIPAFIAFVAAIPSLTTTQVLAGAFFAAWTITATAWLCGGEKAALRLELARLLVQASGAAFLLRHASLSALGERLAAGALALAGSNCCYLLASTLFQPAQKAAGKAA